MSADNYYVVKKHPLGGFTYVQGFASDDEMDDAPPLVATKRHPQYATVREAFYAAEAEPICEYGVSIDADLDWGVGDE